MFRTEAHLTPACPETLSILVHGIDGPGHRTQGNKELKWFYSVHLLIITSYE